MRQLGQSAFRRSGHRLVERLRIKTTTESRQPDAIRSDTASGHDFLCDFAAALATTGVLSACSASTGGF
jgi:hypothetical protein